MDKKEQNVQSTRVDEKRQDVARMNESSNISVRNDTLDVGELYVQHEKNTYKMLFVKAYRFVLDIMLFYLAWILFRYDGKWNNRVNHEKSGYFSGFRRFRVWIVLGFQ